MAGSGDDEAFGLALDGLQDDVDGITKDLRELAGEVAKLEAKIRAEPVPGRTWNWKEFNEDQRAVALTELREWMRTTLVRYPEVFGRLRQCWPEHPYAVDSLTAAYRTWTLAMGANANAEQFAYWLNKWLPALDGQLRESLAECGTGRHISEDIDVSRIG